MLKVLDQHKLPTVTLGSIMVDGAAVMNSLMEGETGTVMLMVDRGTATDDIPDDEAVTVTLTHGAASSASAADYSLSSETVTIAAGAGKRPARSCWRCWQTTRSMQKSWCCRPR